MSDEIVDQVEDLNVTTDSVGKGFFRPVDWSAFWTATLVSFAVYFYTLAPTVTMEDCGEFVVAADHLGVPHPPGYPLWTFISWIFARIFSFVTFRGYPNPSWAVGFVSVVFGALAAGITAMLVSRSGYDMLKRSSLISADLSESTENRICWVSGVSASLLFAFSPVMWSQSVIVEVYSLNAFFLMLIFLLTYMWMRRPDDKLLYITALVFGLGLTNYQVLLLAILPLLFAIYLRDSELFRDFMIVGIMLVVSIAMINIASLLPQPGLAEKHLLDSTYYMVIIGLNAGIVLCSIIAWYAKVAAEQWPPLIRAGLKKLGINEDSVREIPAFIPLLLLGVLVIALLITLTNIRPAVIIPARPGAEMFSWMKYNVGFIGAMGLLVLLCITIPSGYLPAIAFFSIQFSMAFLLRRGALDSLVHPTSPWFQFYLLLNFLYLGFAVIWLPRGGKVAFTALMAELGAAFYVYMPIVSDLRNPPMNWGYPRTWEGFKHAISRGQYEKIKPTDVFSGVFLQQLGDYMADLRLQFTLPVALFGFLPFTAWRIKLGKLRLNALSASIWLCIIATSFVLIEEVLERVGLPGVFPPVLYKAAIAFVLLMMLVGGLLITLSLMRGWFLVALDRSGGGHSLAARVTHGLGVLGGLGGAAMLSLMLLRKAVEVSEPLRSGVFGELSVYDVMLQSGGLVAVAVVPWLAAVLFLILMYDRERDFGMNLDTGSQKWVIATLIGFLIMSVLLMILANPTGDIQDMFIQRVKFISSHALYALWVGYGILLVLSFFEHTFINKPGWCRVGLCLAAVMWLVPLEQNANNSELLHRYGGAEQHDRDFGWQFGKYQLRGSEAMRWELAPDEEPLPNPEFPPEMEPHAIFFGGTDPGRFVPTYMIYSAHVRPDVYLITQNALADNTYMAVMRDLYGDEIWIPAQNDSAYAFHRYVDDVQSGRRPRSADLRIEGGRVQVSGALGVMEINGILTEMIFERNNYRHAFYVEESYVLQWMYPYLSPHGLIMKINRERTSLSAENARNDLDFWDWYTRRFTSNRWFRRDVVARKSFSKLRSALGGLYANRRMFAEAEAAFNEARMLYPLSPEANFRLVQEVLMPQRRFTEAREVMLEFNRLDPGNTRVPDFISHLEAFEKLWQRIGILEAQRESGQMDVNRAMELAELYQQARQTHLVASIIRNIIETPDLPPQFLFRAAQLAQAANANREMVQALDRLVAVIPRETSPNIYLEIARMYAQAERPDQVRQMMERYLEQNPDDWRGWLDVAILHLGMGESNAAVSQVERAIRLGGQEAVNIINQDQRFEPLRGQIRAPRPAPAHPFMPAEPSREPPRRLPGLPGS